MKIALLNDTHFGCRNDSKLFLDHQEQFFTDLFFPICKEHSVTKILHLGDLFDRRKYINFYTLERSKAFFFDVLKKHSFEMHLILGNHDTYFTTTNDVNSSALLLKEYAFIHIYEKDPIELSFGSTNIVMCPWLVKDTFETSLKKLKKSKAHILMGHFDLKGFEMMKGIVSDHGLDHKQFSHFEQVLSGHFHHGSTYSNVRYLGTQYEMTWSDYGSKKGFYLLDTETRDLEFYENPNRIHHKLEYDDIDLTIDDLTNLDTSRLKNCLLKIMVKNRTNPYLYELFLDKLNDSGAHDVKTVEDSYIESSLNIEELSENVKDTRSVLHSYIDGVDTKIDKKQIKTVIDDLYQEAISL